MDWTRGRTIGRGSSATVSIATANGSTQVFAVKSAELSQAQSLEREQGILSTVIRCPQVVAYKGYDITNEHGKLFYNLFLEYAPGGTLLDTIRSRGSRLEEAMIRSYTRSILLGLHHLHCNGIVHCDVKSRNILVAADGVKIADLGCARLVDEVLHADWATRTPIAGTPAYMAPEVARGEHQEFPADIWALGCTIVEMATGEAPWINISDPISALYQIGFSGNVPEIPSFLSIQAQDFLSKCLKRDPRERWSAAQLLKHAFIIKDQKKITTTSNYVDTPTSTLDPSLWDSVEHLLLETTRNSTHQCSSDPAIERIRQLAQGNEKVLKPNWACDVDHTWVTVRSTDSTKEQEETFGSGQVQDHDLENVIIESMGDGETDVALFSEEYNLVIPHKHEPTTTSIISGLTTSNRSLLCSGNYCSFRSSSSRYKTMFMLCKCRRDGSCNIFNLVMRMRTLVLFSTRQRMQRLAHPSLRVVYTISVLIS